MAGNVIVVLIDNDSLLLFLSAFFLVVSSRAEKQVKAIMPVGLFEIIWRI